MNIVWSKLLLSFFIVAFAAIIGSFANMSSIPTWYAGLEKPFFNPPNSIFGPVWTVLYIMIAISLYKIWTTKSAQPKRGLYILFGAQIILNTLWSVVFFGLRNPELAILVISGLLVSITAMIIGFRRVSTAASYLLIPYLLWTMFATVLNLSIVYLN